MTSAPPDHIHVTEREPDGSWEDCTWCSSLEWYRLVYDPRKPATHAEAEALRHASGRAATGGSNYGDVAKAIKVRYGVTIAPAVVGFAALQRLLTPGKVAAISGSMSAFGPTHRLSKWDPRFDAGHAVLLMNIDGVLLWCDPEAPTAAAVPVTVSWGEVKLFVTAFSGTHLVGTIRKPAPAPTPAPVPVPPKETPVDLVSYLPGYTAKVKAQSNIRKEPRIAGALVTKTTSDLPVTIIGTVVGDKDPANQSTVWFALWGAGGVQYTAKDNIIGLTAPTAAAPIYPDVRPALAAVTTERDAMKARLVIVEPKASLLDAVKASVQALLR